MTGLERIAAERQRQVDQEGWTPEHDALHDHGELARAAACYALQAAYRRDVEELPGAGWPNSWDWKPSSDHVRNLEKAGALIAAEIDRLVDRHDVPGGHWETSQVVSMRLPEPQP